MGTRKPMGCDPGRLDDATCHARPCRWCPRGTAYHRDSWFRLTCDHCGRTEGL